MTASQPNQIIDKTRATIQWSFSEQPGVDGSIFEIFSGKQTQAAAKLKPSRRTVGFSPTRVHATESQKTGKARIPIASGRSGGEVKRAIASIPALEQNWIHYCYNPSFERKRAALKTLEPRLWAQYKAQSDTKGIHNRTMILTLFMLKIQLQQARSFPGLQKWTESRPEAMAQAVSRSSWSDTHSKQWKSVREMILKLDYSALLCVYGKLMKNTG